MRAAIDWSFDLLGPVEQVLFGHLANFAGGFELRSAEAVCKLLSGDGSLGSEAGPWSSPAFRLPPSHSMLDVVLSLVEHRLPRQADGIDVMAPANPLRGVASDAAYLASIVNQIPGPVLLVGHSNGGVVITNAAPQAANVVGLVYVAAFAPDEGETILALAGQATDSLLGPALRPADFPSGDGSAPGYELYIDRAAFHEVFCADLPADQAAAMAVSQQPEAEAGFGEPSGPAGRKSLPSWAVIATADLTIGVSGLRVMAACTGAIAVDVDASHVVMISQPQAVADLIRTALGSVA